MIKIIFFMAAGMILLVSYIMDFARASVQMQNVQMSGDVYAG